MFPRAFRLTRVRGIDVRIDPSWIIVAVLVVWSLMTRWQGPGRSDLTALAMALAGTLGLSASILGHELGHAFEARHRRMHVHGITLFVFGGLTEMDMRTRRPRDEFTVAMIGPWASLVLGAVFGLVTAAIDWYWPQFGNLSDVTGMLGWVNVALAVTNLVPGAPLDGGRVLRAGLWALTGDRHQAAILASWVGQVIALTLAAFAVRLVLTRPDAIIDAIWLGLIGLFLARAARQERHQAVILRHVDRHLADRLRGVGARVTTDTPLDQVEVALGNGRLVAVVAVGDGAAGARVDVDEAAGARVVGALHVDAVAAVDAFDRGFRTAGDAMTPVGELPTVPVDAPLYDVLHQLHDATVVAIVEADGAVVGLVDAVLADQVLRDLDRGAP